MRVSWPLRTWRKAKIWFSFSLPWKQPWQQLHKYLLMLMFFCLVNRLRLCVHLRVRKKWSIAVEYIYASNVCFFLFVFRSVFAWHRLFLSICRSLYRFDHRVWYKSLGHLNSLNWVFTSAERPFDESFAYKDARARRENEREKSEAMR